MKTRFVALLVLIMIAISAVPVFGQDDPGTIADIVVAQAAEGEFTILLAAVQAADPAVLEALSAEGELTVFAPTDAAFGALPPYVLNYVVANPELLTQVLLYHVVEGSVLSTDLADGEVATLDMGNTLDILLLEDGPRINDAQVVAADVAASNGVIHVIDTVLLPPLSLDPVDPLAVSGNIVTAGSSTVFPLTERMADLFETDGFPDTITVDSIGSGGGFERFCVNAETDIANASRPINEGEVESCAANGREVLGFFVAIDALAITVSAENDFVDALSLEDLANIYSGTAATWADINPEWPAESIRLFSPGSDSGTYDYFVEEIFDEDEAPIQNAPGIQFSEDDNVLVNGVTGSTFAIGYFGFAYYQENADVLRTVAIEGVEPNAETGANGTYPLSRPLFIYSAPSIMQEKPQVASFISYYLQNANSQLGTASDQIGYIPTTEYIARRNALMFIAGTAGAMGM